MAYHTALRRHKHEDESSAKLHQKLNWRKYKDKGNKKTKNTIGASTRIEQHKIEILTVVANKGICK